MKNLILFGDSHFGRFGRDYILKLEASLKDVTVYNCAAGGSDTRDGLKRAAYIAKLKPEYICLSFGANDSSPFKGQPVKLPGFIENMKSIIKTFSLAGSTIIIFPCPNSVSRNGWVAEDFNSSLSTYNKALRGIATETGSFFFDSETMYKNVLDEGKDIHTEDGLHLNELGYQIFIDEVSKMVEECDATSS